VTEQFSKPLKWVGKCDKKLNNLHGRAGPVYIWQGHREEECFGDCQQSKPGGQSSSSLLSGSELELGLSWNWLWRQACYCRS